MLKRLVTLTIPLIVQFYAGSAVSANASDNAKKELEFAIGAGPSLVTFDSNFKTTNMQNGNSLYIDTEGTLGLPEKDTSPILLMNYRISKTHAIGLSYVGIHRKNELLNVKLPIGDYTAYGDIIIQDNTKYYSFNYSYTMFRDDRSFVQASVGLFGLDLALSLDATGGIRNGNEIIEDDTLSNTLGVFAPLPLVGLDFWWAYTPRWGLGTKVSLVAGSYADVKAIVVDTSIRGVYRINRHFEAFVGIKYFSGDVTINDAPYRHEISYGLNGLLGGLGYKF